MLNLKRFSVGVFLANLVSFITVMTTVVSVLGSRHAMSSDVEKGEKIPNHILKPRQDASDGITE